MGYESYLFVYMRPTLVVLGLARFKVSAIFHFLLPAQRQNLRWLVRAVMELHQRHSPSRAEAIDGGGGSSEEHVMSEVHLGCPPNHPGPHISCFTISMPALTVDSSIISPSVPGEACEVDEDGDLILTRRRGCSKFKSTTKHCLDASEDLLKDSFVVTIQHNITSSIQKVGLQVWRAELVLADFVIHMMRTTSDFDGVVAIELGAGTGLVGMLLARAANTIFVTDVGDEVLENCIQNINLNAPIYHKEASIYVRELDWTQPWPPEFTLNSPSQQNLYKWSMSEVKELERATAILAADVIYSDDLTDALFHVLESIMSGNPEKVLYLALEKRYNFSIDDLDVVANGYSHFRSYIKEEKDVEVDRSCKFTGRLINLEDIPVYVQEYERGNDVELWQIKYVKQVE